MISLRRKRIHTLGEICQRPHNIVFQCQVTEVKYLKMLFKTQTNSNRILEDKVLELMLKQQALFLLKLENNPNVYQRILS